MKHGVRRQVSLGYSKRLVQWLWPATFQGPPYYIQRDPPCRRREVPTYGPVDSSIHQGMPAVIVRVVRNDPIEQRSSEAQEIGLRMPEAQIGEKCCRSFVRADLRNYQVECRLGNTG